MTSYPPPSEVYIAVPYNPASFPSNDIDPDLAAYFVAKAGDTMSGVLNLNLGATSSAKITTTDFKMTTGAVNNYILASDAVGDATWTAPNSTITYPLEADDGTILLPSYSFASDPNTGISRVNGDELSFSAGGILQMSIDTSNVKATQFLANGPNSQILIEDSGASDKQWNVAVDSGIFKVVETGVSTWMEIDETTGNVSLSSTAIGTVGNPGDASLNLTGGFYIGDDSVIENGNLIIRGTQTNAIRIENNAGQSTLGVDTNTEQLLVVRNNAPATPVYSFNGDTNTGMYWIGFDNIGVSCGGVLQLDIDTSNLTCTKPIRVKHQAGADAFQIARTLGDYTFGIRIADFSGSWGSSAEDVRLANGAGGGSIGLNAGGKVVLTISSVSKFQCENTINTSSVILDITATDNATSKTTGALRVAGGLGVAGDVWATQFVAQGTASQFVIQDSGDGNKQWNIEVDADVFKITESGVSSWFQIAETTGNVSLVSTGVGAVAGSGNASLNLTGGAWIGDDTVIEDGSLIIHDSNDTAFTVEDTAGVAVLTVDTNLKTTYAKYNSGDSQLIIERSAADGGGGGLKMEDWSGVIGGTVNDFILDSATAGTSFIHLETGGGVKIHDYRSTAQTELAIYGSDGTDYSMAIEMTTFDNASTNANGRIRIRADAVSEAFPNYSFENDTNTGMYWIDSDNIGFSCAGSNVLDITTTEATFTNTVVTPTLKMTTAPTAGYILESDASGSGSWVAPPSVTTFGDITVDSIAFSDGDSNRSLDYYRYINVGTRADRTDTFPFFTDASSIIFEKMQMGLSLWLSWGIRTKTTEAGTASILICSGVIDSTFIKPYSSGTHTFHMTIDVDGAGPKVAFATIDSSGDFRLYNGSSLTATFPASVSIVIYAGSTLYVT